MIVVTTYDIFANIKNINKYIIKKKHYYKKTTFCNRDVITY